MTTHVWSSFGTGTFTVDPFNPNSDVLRFDNAAISRNRIGCGSAPSFDTTPP